MPEKHPFPELKTQQEIDLETRKENSMLFAFVCAIWAICLFIFSYTVVAILKFFGWHDPFIERLKKMSE